MNFLSKLTRRDLYAFYVGNVAVLLVLSFLGGQPTMFLVSGALMGFDLYCFVGQVNKGDANEQDNQ